MGLPDFAGVLESRYRWLVAGLYVVGLVNFFVLWPMLSGRSFVADNILA